MTFFYEILVIAAGGAIGAVLRFLLSRLVQGDVPVSFPWGIFACNLIGSFLIGILAGLMLFKSDFGALWRMFLIVGLLGGFTTFSSFSLDSITFLREGMVGAAFANIGLSLVGCLLATYIGLMIVRG